MIRLAALAGLAILAMTAGAAALVWRLTEPLPTTRRAPERLTLAAVAAPVAPEAPPPGPAPSSAPAAAPGAVAEAAPSLQAERAAAEASGVDWRTLERMLAEGQEDPGATAAGQSR